MLQRVSILSELGMVVLDRVKINEELITLVYKFVFFFRSDTSFQLHRFLSKVTTRKIRKYRYSKNLRNEKNKMNTIFAIRRSKLTHPHICRSWWFCAINQCNWYYRGTRCDPTETFVSISWCFWKPIGHLSFELVNV